MISPADNRLTPRAVQAVAFPPARIGRRGLDEDHVRAFCGLVERELVRLFNERASLAAEVDRLRRRVPGQSRSGSGAGTPEEDAHLQGVRILSEAQQTAQRYVADAREYSMRLAAEAQRRRDEVLAEAQSRAIVMIENAYGHVSTSVDALHVLSRAVASLKETNGASRAGQAGEPGQQEPPPRNPGPDRPAPHQGNADPA